MLQFLKSGPAQGHKDDYLGIAAALRADLDRIDGFISVECFKSLSDPEKLLSLSFWRDEAAEKTGETIPNTARVKR